mmetsp:Transcript_181164/g.574824  ORF Transcript_181164/g.574824 Transcript_181164/m.574824 type:complete len:201 (+) Transcript_181164:1476-2078(+)
MADVFVLQRRACCGPSPNDAVRGSRQEGCAAGNGQCAIDSVALREPTRVLQWPQQALSGCRRALKGLHVPHLCRLVARGTHEQERKRLLAFELVTRSTNSQIPLALLNGAARPALGRHLNSVAASELELQDHSLSGVLHRQPHGLFEMVKRNDIQDLFCLFGEPLPCFEDDNNLAFPNWILVDIIRALPQHDLSKRRDRG